MQSFVEVGEDRRWSAFLSRSSLLAGVTALGLIVAFVAGVLPAGGSGEPAIYRLTIALQRRHPAMGRGAEIAESLFLSLKTVRNYVSNIFTKMQVADRAQAIVRAREVGLGQNG